MTELEGVSPFPPYRDAELVIGLVGAVGTDLEGVQTVLTGTLKKYAYDAFPIRLSQFLRRFKDLTVDESGDEYKRINTSMTAGNELRAKFQRNDVLALHAASEILGRRNSGAPMTRQVHILNSLKRPEEVDALRQIYGAGFFLMGVYSTEKHRREYLRFKNIQDEGNVDRLIKRDAKEEEILNGQNTRDTFELADVFVRLRPAETTNPDIERFFELVFGYPYQTPSQDEHAMFLAYAAAIRSADLSRQVGAVVVSEGGDVIGIGTNEVPFHGGGLCWPGEGDCRDFKRGYDSNEMERTSLFNEVVEASIDSMKEIGRTIQLDAQGTLARILDEFRKVSLSPAGPFANVRLMDITEYGRAVHGEMEAILSCARTGISTRNATLYVTTFPCHNCAKHIINAGIRKVVFVEPYPKSKAFDLYDDFIGMEDGDSAEQRGPAASRKVQFAPFVGIGPRRYVDLFSMKLGSGSRMLRKTGGKVISWDPTKAHPRIPMGPASYLDREAYAGKWVLERTEKG